jgi:hypothetical protein
MNKIHQKLRIWLYCEKACYKARFNKVKNNLVRKLFKRIIKSDLWWIYNKLEYKYKPPLVLYAVSSNQSSFVAKAKLRKWGKDIYADYVCPVQNLIYRCEILDVGDL